MYEIWGFAVQRQADPTPQLQDDALARSKMQQTHTKTGRNGIWLGTWEAARGNANGWNLNLQPLAESFQYWCQNSEKWALLFYLALKLWTMTQAIINSVGPSITVSILHGAVQNWKTEPQQCLASLHLLLDLLDWYKTCPIYEMFNYIQKELWGSSKNHTNCLVLHCIGTASVLSYGLEAKQLENSSSGFSAVASLLI